MPLNLVDGNEYWAMLVTVRKALLSYKSTSPILFCLLLAACHGSGEGLDSNGRPLTQTDTGNQLLTARFSSISANVLTPDCATSGCHSGVTAPVGLNLDTDVAYDALVNQLSSQQGEFFRVSPGDPDNSYLVQKLEGTAAVGSQMPRNQPPLPVETIAIIRQWIADGAADD